MNDWATFQPKMLERYGLLQATNESLKESPLFFHCILKVVRGDEEDGDTLTLQEKSRILHTPSKMALTAA